MLATSLTSHALVYIQHGYSVIATDEHKRPAVESWKIYQEQKPSEQLITQMFSNYRAKGVAVICGSVSGNLEVIDIDSKHDRSGTLFEDFMQALHDTDAQLASKLLIAKTLNGGYHIYSRCEQVAGNQKLASRPTTTEEQKDNPHHKVVVLIETRGEGGYVVAEPSTGYKFMNGNPRNCPLITVAERETLLEIARSFNQYYEKPFQHTPEEKATNKKYTLSPFEDYNQKVDIKALLESHGWTVVGENSEKIIFKRPGNTTSKSSGNFNKRLGWFSVFTTSSAFETDKAYQPYAVYAMLECDGDFKLAAKKLLDAGYGVRDISITNKAKKPITQHEQLKNNYKQQLTIARFWEVNPKNFMVTIVQHKLEKFLSEQGGFFLYFYNPNSKIFKLIRNKNGIIEEASREQIKKFIKGYVLDLPEYFDGIHKTDLQEAVYRGDSHYFRDSFYEFLQSMHIDFLKDTEEIAYFPFNNGVVCVTKEGYQLHSYEELGKSIWRSQITDHNILLYNNDNPIDIGSIDYYQFIKKICAEDTERIEYCMAITGYLLHKYKDPAKPYCIILGEDTEDDRRGGGSGKGIFITALSKLLNCEQIDGKNFKVDKNFAFQRVKLDTRLIAIQDVRKNVDFEGFYSIITEGITIEKKNKDELFIPYADSPKIIFTTNYVIPNVSDTAKRRQRIVEFSSFFNARHTPLDHFGHRLFDDWSPEQWNMFYNFMFACVQQYLISGIPERFASINTKNKQIRNSYGEEFLSWWEDYIEDSIDKPKMFGDLYNQFLAMSELERREYSQKRFKKALEESASITGYYFISRRNKQSGGKIEVILSKKVIEK